MAAPAKTPILLLRPPATKPCEAPAGIARLLGALRSAGFSCVGSDLGFDMVRDLLLDPKLPADDTWTRRAHKNRKRSLELLKTPAGYANPDRYGRAVEDLNRLLALHSAGDGGSRLSLSDYDEDGRSPVRSADLLEIFARPETSPLYGRLAPRLRALLEREKPAAVGLSVSFLSQALPAFAIAGLVRKEAPETKLLLGGSLVTSWLRLPDFKNPFAGAFDLMAGGPGEGALLGFAAGGDGGTNFREKAAFRGTEEAQRRKKQPKTCFFSPDYADFLDLPYLTPGFILPYAASSGCAYRKCAFCPEKAEATPYSSVPAERAVRELEDLIRRTKPALVHFLDSEMCPTLLSALAERPLGVPWYGFARAGKELEDEEFCRALGRAGCVLLKLGIESGDQGVLDAMEKGTTTEGNSRVLRSLGAAGIGTFVYLLFGTPAEGPEEARRTLEFAASHADSIDFFNLAVFNLPRGSGLAAGLETAQFYEGDLSLYSEFVHPRGWNRGEVRTFIDRSFKRHPALAPVVRRLPAYFGSNHAAFFTRAYRAWGQAAGS